MKATRPEKEITKDNGYTEETLPEKIEMQLSRNEQLEVWVNKRKRYLQLRLDTVIEYQLAELVKNESAMKAQMETLKQVKVFIDHLNKEIAALE